MSSQWRPKFGEMAVNNGKIVLLVLVVGLNYKLFLMI
jgi:hypothetical protein